MHLVNRYKVVTLGTLLFLGASLFYLLLLSERLNFLFKPVTTKPPQPLGLETQTKEIHTGAKVLNGSRSQLLTNEIPISHNDDDNYDDGPGAEVLVDFPTPKLEMENLDSYVLNQTVKNFGRTSRIFHPMYSLELDRPVDKSKLASLENEEFTIVMMTYKRTEMMLKLLKHLDHLPNLNQLILIWNNQELPEPELKWPTVSYTIRLVSNHKNTLHNRYLPLSIVTTEAIFLLDDDSFVVHEKFNEAFRIWQNNRDRIVGFKGRGVKYVQYSNGSSLGRWIYDPIPRQDAVSLVLTGCAFLHRNFMDLYTYEMPLAMRKIIDETMNCDDLAINFLVADRIQKSPIFVRHEASFLCSGCEDNGLWKDSSHFKERTNCLNQFSEIFGYMPLFKQGPQQPDGTIKVEDCGRFTFQSWLPRSLVPSLTTSISNTFQCNAALTLTFQLLILLIPLTAY